MTTQSHLYKEDDVLKSAPDTVPAASCDQQPMPEDYGGYPRAGCGLEGAHAKIEWIANTCYAMRHMRSLDTTWGGQLITMAAVANFLSKQIAAADRAARTQPVAAPLTDEQIMAALPGGILDSLADPWNEGDKNADNDSSIRTDVLRVARAVEKAHGIGQERSTS